MIPGRGVLAAVNGKSVLAGNPELLKENGVDLPDLIRTKANSCLADGSTVIYLAVDRRAAGFLVLSDTLRTDAAEMIRQVEQTGITPVLLTGDHRNAGAEKSLCRHRYGKNRK